jgi:hypothetical protein
LLSLLWDGKLFKGMVLGNGMYTVKKLVLAGGATMISAVSWLMIDAGGAGVLVTLMSNLYFEKISDVC